MKAADVVVTGLGIVSPLGATARDSCEAWRAGLRARREALKELAGTPLEAVEVSALPRFDPAERLGGRRMLKYMSDAAMLGCVAAREASTDADVKRRFRPERVGLYAATGLAAAAVSTVRSMVTESTDSNGRFSCRLLGKRGLAVANPLLSFKILANMPPCLVSVLEGVKGPSLIFTPWEGQTGAALCEAWRAVAEGEVDCALAGAADNAAHPATLVYLKHSRRLRDGEAPAAGAAYVVMERADTARRDRQPVHARIVSMHVQPCDGPAWDPLAARMGRTFAAAPAILLALACLEPAEEVFLCGADHQSFRAQLKTAD